MHELIYFLLKTVPDILSWALLLPFELLLTFTSWMLKKISRIKKVHRKKQEIIT